MRFASDTPYSSAIESGVNQFGNYCLYIFLALRFSYNAITQQGNYCLYIFLALRFKYNAVTQQGNCCLYIFLALRFSYNAVTQKAGDTPAFHLSASDEVREHSKAYKLQGS